MTNGYVATLRLPGIVPVLAGGIIGRLTYGIIPFATVVVFSTAHGFAAAGVATAAFMLANALLAPLRGRLVDRRGPATLLVMASAHLVAVVGAAIVVASTWWLPAVVFLACAGATIPPIGPALRTSWSQLVNNKQHLQQIHALDSVVEESTFVAAPLLTIALIATTSGRWALLIGAALLVPAVVVIARYGHLEQAAGGTDSTAAGTNVMQDRRRPLMLRPTGQGIVTPIVTLGTVGGGLTVLLPALAERAGDITAAGYAFAAYSLGGAVTGLIFGRLRWTLPLHRKYTVLTGCFTLGVALLIPVTSITLTMAAVFLAGAALTPMFVVAYLLVDERIEGHRLTEANSWLSSGYNLGSAAGAALCGFLISQTDSTVVAATFTLIAALGMLGSLRIPSPQPTVDATARQ